jgi:hypothetical protein
MPGDGTNVNQRPDMSPPKSAAQGSPHVSRPFQSAALDKTHVISASDAATITASSDRGILRPGVPNLPGRGVTRHVATEDASQVTGSEQLKALFRPVAGHGQRPTLSPPLTCPPMTGHRAGCRGSSPTQQCSSSARVFLRGLYSRLVNVFVLILAVMLVGLVVKQMP